MFAPAALLLACALQCTDPPTPPAGFLYDEALDVQVTFSDGETTTANLRWPRDPAGPCGWPLLLFVHGLNGSKVSLGALSRDFAEAGFVTMTFDVRGHATASGAHTLWGQRERLDMVELIGWAQTWMPGLVDGTRVGVGGQSQGGILSFALSAWSGRPIEPNPWISGVYPDVRAVVVENLTADFSATLAPQSQAVHCNAAASLFDVDGVRFDPGLVQDAIRAVLQEDYAGWAAIVGDPTRDPGPLVPQMTTPVLAMGAWDDFWFPMSSLIDTLAQMPPGVPQKVYLGTVGHSSPPNQDERAFRAQARREWFDRFLKGGIQPLRPEPRITYAVTPSDVNEYLSPASAWEHGESDVWPPEGTLPYRLYVRHPSRLLPMAPTDFESAELLQQVVGPGYGPADVVAAAFRLPQIEAEIPRVSLDWDTHPLISAVRFVGEPKVEVALVAQSQRWQVGASLWDVDPSGSERYITSGSYFADDVGAIGVQRTIEVRMNANAYEFPIGHRIRLKLGNMHVHEPPVGSLLRYAPTYEPFTLEILHDPLALTWLDLPVSDALPISYGWSQTNSQGCAASARASGTASATDPAPFWIEASDVLNQKDGLLVYGHQIWKHFLNGHYLFAHPPLVRCGIVNSGGNVGPADCSGVLRYDFNARLRSMVDPTLAPGQRIYAQFWSRDPASPWATNLTNGVQFTIFP